MRGARCALRTLLLGLLGIGGAGCISLDGHFGSPIPTQLLPRIVDGETTRQEIAAWFGPPSAFYNPTFLDAILGRSGDLIAPDAPILNDVYTYRYVEMRTEVFFVPVLYGRVRSESLSETLTVFFDEEGRVRYHAYRQDRAAPQ